MALDEAFEVIDKRFHRYVIHNAHIDHLWTGARWAEGPVYAPAGRFLLFSDIPNDRTLRYDETTGEVATFDQPAWNANGHTLDREGRMVACEHRGRAVTRIGHHGRREILADRFEGKRLNSPNDVVVHSDGAVWFTDPTYGIDSEYEGDRAESEIGASNVYRIDPVTGAVAAVITDMVRPNGLAFSPDEQILYVADTGISHVGPGLPARHPGLPHGGRRHGRRRELHHVRHLHQRRVRRVPGGRRRQHLDLGRRRRPLLRPRRDPHRQDPPPRGGGQRGVRRHQAQPALHLRHHQPVRRVPEHPGRHRRAVRQPGASPAAG
ncbi:MAG: SMP-30/gluconolactonase/LRE family protein [Acidimicrobiales bacterium]